MNGETNLQKLIKEMKPELNAGEYVYCTTNSMKLVISLEPIFFFNEKEAVTMILPKEKADSMVISYTTICVWITLTVHSSLEAVGLTAAFSQALADENISCNVVAAFYHDHIFVPAQDAERAMDVLNHLSRRTQ